MQVERASQRQVPREIFPRRSRKNNKNQFSLLAGIRKHKKAKQEMAEKNHSQSQRNTQIEFPEKRSPNGFLDNNC